MSIKNLEIRLDSPEEQRECIYSERSISPDEEALCIEIYSSSVYVKKHYYHDFIDFLENITLETEVPSKNMEIDCGSPRNILVLECSELDHSLVFYFSEISDFVDELKSVGVD